MGSVPENQGTISVAATEACTSLSEVTGYGRVVNQWLKSVVREIRTLRYVGIGGGWPSLMTRWQLG